MSRAEIHDFDHLAAAFGGLVARAGAIAMETFSAERIEARSKSDASPVCEADERIEAYLLDALAQLAPEFPVVAEEAAARGELPERADAFLLVDPLDGTREFLAHGRDFTINIGLIVDRAPCAGAVFAPALGELWLAGERAFAMRVEPGASALPSRDRWRELRTRKAPADGLIALVSRSHQDEETRAFLAKLRIADARASASSIKFCRLAEGAADVYPRFGPTMEWDTAAGDAVLRAAGGRVVDPSNKPLLYGKAEAHYRNGPFIAWGEAPTATLS